MSVGSIAVLDSRLEIQSENPPASETTAAPRARYRSDIDGLRAIAVLAVILTHAGVRGFSGGFVGVDVFFVISGYLIYRDLLRRSGEGRLSLLCFYGRRMRRTLPALFAVCAVTLAAAIAVLMPGDLDEMARSLIGAVCLVPNILFLTQAGYFDQAAAAKPLLHTWSLGVEEQFYLLAPLLVVVLARLTPDRRKVALLGLFAASLAFTVVLQALAPDAAFYLMPARVFEFLIGAVLAEAILPTILSLWLAEAVTALALVGLALSITSFTDRWPHPGWPTLLPCLSTAAIIHVGLTRRTRAAMLLGSRGPAFLGLISYSLYLWHWPMLVIARYTELPMTPWLGLAGAAGLLLVSAASWRWIEQPFRAAGSVWRARAPVLIPAAGASLVACAAFVIAMHGLPSRFPPDVASVAGYYAYRDQQPFREGRCFITSKNSLGDFDRGTCLALAPDKPNVLLLGDSHAAHLWTGLREAWPEANVLQATASGCKPEIGTAGASRCTTLMRDMLTAFIPAHTLDTLVVGGLWDESDIAPLRQTLAAVKPFVRRIVLFGPMPRYNEPVATLLAKSMLRHRLEALPRHLVPGTRELDDRLRAAVSPFATYVSSYDILCPSGSCRLFASPGVPMQFDYHHLTAPGASVLMAAVKRDQPRLLTP